MTNFAAVPALIGVTRTNLETSAGENPMGPISKGLLDVCKVIDVLRRKG